MSQRVNVLWGIGITLLLLTMIWIGYSDYKISKQVENFQKKQIILGSDEQLQDALNTLETELNERIAYSTTVENDPLDLTKAIQSRKFLASLGLKETLEEQGRMRLSATVISEDPSAIVKFMGRSHILHIGDNFNGFSVRGITKAEMILEKGGSRLVLVNESAPEGELSESNTSISGSN